MSNVTDLARWRDEHRPHAVSFAKCMVCAREWVAVTPADPMPKRVECPRCRTLTGELFPSREESRTGYTRRLRARSKLRLVTSGR